MGLPSLKPPLKSTPPPNTQVQDGYELRLDNTLPKRDPRDRNPGVDGCQ